MRASPLSALVLAFALAALSVTWFARATEATRSYKIIVHPSNSTTEVDRRFLEDAFLRKITRWPNDIVIYPVDLTPNSPVRRKFSEEILHRSVEAVKVYWQQRIFSGRDVPPPELDTDDDVVAYVLKHDGAVGYISENTDPDGAKVVEAK
ncbi:MAG: hypothetical protein M3O50_08885 [Myxococcota bacterium]|nr:hypothetical protein [Myxococcota bacterium]